MRGIPAGKKSAKTIRFARRDQFFYLKRKVNLSPLKQSESIFMPIHVQSEKFGASDIQPMNQVQQQFSFSLRFSL
jgi:hypothetical protein